MSYLNFDKTLLINLERSLGKEMIRTNRAGAYNSTTLVDCNTRKYHGQLVLPLPELSDDNYVLLSSLDETVIQHGAEFNLGLHQYEDNNFAPNGHKYIREFDCEVISRTTYRVGGVILSKERMLVSFEPRVLIRYTLIEAHSPTTLRFRPFLAFRSVNALTQENNRINSTCTPISNGGACQMYPEFPTLYMQFSKHADYVHNPLWYKNIEYFKEQERGYDYKEDLWVPGYFEMPMKKGESVIFSAGISETTPRTLKSVWERELKRRISRKDMFACLKNSAAQFYKREGDKCYLLAGYPWFKPSAREEFFALPSCTLMIDRPEYWEAIMDNTAIEEVRHFLHGEHDKIRLTGMDEPDVLLWFIRALQQYAAHTSLQETADKYGDICAEVTDYIRKQRHPRMWVHANGLVYVEGKERPATWMNAIEDGRPITPRTGYVVEINALWYNALCFTAEILRQKEQLHQADLLDYQAQLTKKAFSDTFWNGFYLDDYVVNNYHDKEVRPNQIWAVSLPYSPLDKKQRKAVVDICTKELLTPRGLRTISPKSGGYRPIYIGGQLERDRNFHNGPVWPCTIAAYARAYMQLYKRSGKSFIERMLVGYEAEMSELCIGTLNELYDGNPPYKGHGGMSYAPSVAAVISVIDTLKKYDDNE
ncbi:MAG: amylo-alpha-1,6-glucosidase [Paludibacter sp.]|nr:amylo-alpha-1,6-glucosidase [Bacteroidales bacterium]MCM1069230.1 amylo-alpha-1,6-glucosidase [Prevotella sp.]MCM1354350.1 amylo-alpha-1,6-glucosidase [Bacteroides sp.]MCM1443190.1 amylo-alpha-1,6-glucosidase [Muribaculum sp.]MCM1481785.1 amylo-alpha-1,6-glucosidase [Paludibacter sp.]